MSKARLFVAALAAAVLASMVAAPANAASLGASCTAGSGYRLVAEARVFFSFDLFYELTGGLDKSNVNIRIKRSNGTTKWSYNSPDDRKPGIRYYIPVNVRPEFGDRVHFTGIFDRPIWSDPRCTASTRQYEGDV